MKAPGPRLFLWGLALLLALRLWHFGPEIDAPHDWRQCDTAWYIRDFYQNGIDLLHPAVCWMGASDTLALEFPLPEAVAALAYQVSGESIPMARLVFLCFFAGALYYFHRIACLLFGAETARLSTLVYLALPLSLFYSRAVHIDFSALLPAHAMLYYYLVGVQKQRIKWLIISGLAAIPALLVKAPYAMCCFLPMLYATVQRRRFVWAFRSAWVFLPALAAFVWWQQHVNRINGAAPDWEYILHYRKMTQAAHWYFGALEQRLSLYSWKILLQRGVLDITGIGGIVFFLFGLRNFHRWPGSRFLFCWIAGLAVYVLVFFNLNVVHDYYQIPLLAPAAILCARGIKSAAAGSPTRLYLFFALLLVVNLVYAETFYYKVSAGHVEAGRLIRENTPDSALVIVTFGNMDCRNPKVLYRARRKGWSVEEAALRPEVIDRLRREEDAQFWAFIGADMPPEGMRGYADTLPPPEVFHLEGFPGKLHLFDLR